jgi:hypothetical protein
MPPRNRLLSYLLIVAGVAVLTGTALYYLHIKQAEGNALENNLPQSVADLPLAQLIVGQEAIKSIHQLHGKDFPLVGGAVAVYGTQNVILWVSDAGSVSAAADLTELMKVRIGEGRSPFEELGSFDLGEFVIYELDGMGQTHFYWQSGRLVLWLAADGELAEEALHEVADFYQ